MIIDLSIDFDFFIYESFMWDFGHNESPMFIQMAWEWRYQHVDLFTETDIKIKADFQPHQIINKLKTKGILYTNRPRVIGFSESHLDAFRFFEDLWLSGRHPDKLICLDAHHDMFSTGGNDLTSVKIDCGNWLYNLQRFFGKSMPPIIQVYPKWKKPADDGTPRGQIAEIHQWPDWSGIEATIRHVFLCRSGAWVPPHHDRQFNTLVKQFGPARELRPLTTRWSPSRKEAKEWFEEHQQWQKKIRKELINKNSTERKQNDHRMFKYRSIKQRANQ